MPKFEHVALGNLARRNITVDDPRAGTLTMDVRYLDDSDDDAIEQGAELFARARGATPPPSGSTLPTGASANPWRGNPHYERGHVLNTLLVACIDSASPEAAPEPYFSSIASIQKLHAETINQILLQQRIWQGEQSLQLENMKGSDVLAHIMEMVVAEDARPFVRLGPSLQWNLMRTLACLCIVSHGTKLLSSWHSVKMEIEGLKQHVKKAMEEGEPLEPVPVPQVVSAPARPAAKARRHVTKTDRNRAKANRKRGGR